MSGSIPRRLVASMPVALILAAACGGESERGSTLPSTGREANPQAESLPTEPVDPATIHDHVVSKARALAGTEYSAPDTTLPPSLAELDYDQYRSIRFRSDAALWRGMAAFEVQLFHPGYLFREPVQIHLVDDERVVDFPFQAKLFDYEGPASHLADVVSPLTGYAGFRVHFPLNDSIRKDEVAVFQGASYFRLVGPGQVYGLSARGLAIDIAREGGEEFPDFREYWLVQPAPGDPSLVFYALLDSPSVTGAYRFELEPNTNTNLHVDARLFARREIRTLGVAPLSSMFLHDTNLASKFDDVRPEVHDSDGLLMWTGRDEWIWRPLGNGRGLRVTSLRDSDPKGFGLAQRERDFESYLDIEAQYHRRPSAWIEMDEGDWGGGGVELLEIPTPNEFNDNIAAYWVPDAPFGVGEERHFRYRITTFGDQLASQTLARVERTRIGGAALPGQTNPPPPALRRFIVDFTGAALSGLDPSAPIEAVLQTSAGTLSQIRTQQLPDALGWRVSFRLDPDRNSPSDMRLYLEIEGAPVSETWTYVWYADQER
jgi:glucans biosynthesis protein